MIIILAEDSDLHADSVVWYLKNSGAEIARFDPSKFFLDESNILNITDCDDNYIIAHGEKIYTEEITAVYSRCYSFEKAPDTCTVSEHLRCHEARSALAGFLSSLDACWINNPFAEDRADNKILQYKMAKAAGLQIPPTLITNSPDEFIAFYNLCKGDVIIKQLSDVCLIEEIHFINAENLPDSRGLGFYTQEVKSLNHVREIAATPCHFQKKIPKKSELRVNVIGAECFAWRIYSQVEDKSRLDFRLGENLNCQRVKLSNEYKNRLVSFVKSLGIIFAAIDIIETPDDELIFLEANVNGNWLWLEQPGQSLVAEKLAEMLINPSF